MGTYTVGKIALMQVAADSILICCLYSGTRVAAAHLECPLPGFVPSIADATQESRQLLVAHSPYPVSIGFYWCLLWFKTMLAKCTRRTIFLALVHYSMLTMFHTSHPLNLFSSSSHASGVFGLPQCSQNLRTEDSHFEYLWQSLQ